MGYPPRQEDELFEFNNDKTDHRLVKLYIPFTGTHEPLLKYIAVIFFNNKDDIITSQNLSKIFNLFFNCSIKI